MATQLFLHNAANAFPGTYPAGEQSTRTASVTWTGATTIRSMDTTIGAGQIVATANSLAQTTQQDHLIRMFASPPLSGAQTVGGGTMILNFADAESNTNANFWVDSLNVYVWRPSTGALVGTLRDAADLGGAEALGANTEQVTHITGITSSAVSAQNGDVVICEVWARVLQGMATSYVYSAYYDGTTVNNTENATVTNHASYLQLTETLVFQSGVVAADPFGMMGFFGV